VIGARLVAFALLACAAFAWPLPWLDRAGTAALGLAFLALALPLRPRERAEQRSETVPPATVDVRDDPAERIITYLAAGMRDEEA